MFKMFFTLIIVFACSFTFASSPIADDPKLEITDLHTAYIPAGYDSNDRIVLMAEGLFSSTCYRVAPPVTVIDNKEKKITITQKAHNYNVPCLELIVNYNQPIHLGLLAPGTYTVINGGDNTELGKLTVAAAKNKGPDDFLYAPLTDAVIKRDKNDHVVATVSALLSNRCMKLKDVKVIEDGKNVVTLLPIAEISGESRCRYSLPYNYTRTIALPELDGKTGRFMLNARSLNGQAITKLFDL
ncbi:MAG: hypothetical protein IPM57_03085 [Oligoflexia bacterium]|nr:hypothetical protein [Oligoflexia bacterium]